MDLFPDYNPLWKNDLSDNWIINDLRQRAEELVEEMEMENPSEWWSGLV